MTTLPDANYCDTCGGEFGNDISEDHVCPFADDNPEWCCECGAELTDFGTCHNDHDEEP